METTSRPVFQRHRLSGAEASLPPSEWQMELNIGGADASDG